MSRRRFRRKKNRSASIDMGPMIDMVFLLLIFYIVTTSFVKEAGVEISRPSSSQALSVNTSFVPIAIHKSGTIHLNGRIIQPEDSAAIAQVLAAAGTKRIVVQADRDVPTYLLLKVMDVCKLAGAKQIDVAAVK
ncbi:MAG: biopolymer transporter ExbD [Lentisphaeria bacterium]|nr:biopolymer transporter ExbD [Lentisphaeria bacterium]NQZ70314.1 biopolymer transporter ExbD [Lentisphaeria bacterium]